MLNKYKYNVNFMLSMSKIKYKRTMKLQQPDFTRYFVTIPFNFIKKLGWTKGDELEVRLIGDILQIQNKTKR